jgi:hypothetical protein
MYIFRGAFPRKIYLKNNSFARGPNASLYPNPSLRAATKRLHLKGEIGTPAPPHPVIAGVMPAHAAGFGPYEGKHPPAENAHPPSPNPIHFARKFYDYLTDSYGIFYSANHIYIYN